jgi:hypothetical protein
MKTKNQKTSESTSIGEVECSSKSKEDNTLQLATEECINFDCELRNVEDDLNNEDLMAGTFFDVEKSSEGKPSHLNYLIKNDSLVTLKISELEPHPLNKNIYSEDSQKISRLAENIKEHSLIQRIIVNTNNQILSGNMRFKALQKLGIEYVEVYVINIKEEDELDFIISANHQRERSIIDAKNEIRYLYNKYSPGQGCRTGENRTNTVKKIAEITGYKTNKISTIRKIDLVYPDLLLEVDRGSITLNGALKKCDFMTGLIQIGRELGENLVSEITPENLEAKFNSEIKSYCKKHQPAYHMMIKNGEIGPLEAYTSIFKNNEKITRSDLHSEEGHTGRVDDSVYCPFCSHKVVKKLTHEWISKYEEKLRAIAQDMKLNPTKYDL